MNIPWWKNYNKTKQGCWEWAGSISIHGYGHKCIDYKQYRIHRLFYERFIEPIKKDMIICHRCNNKKCVNPEHLYMGTYQDNANDRRLAGTDTAGERNYWSKLTAADVVSIRKDNRSKVEIAKDYNVTPTQIVRIIKRKRWKSI